MAKTTGSIHLIYTFLAVCLATIVHGQDLEPRAYTWVPVKVTIMTLGANYSTGDIVTDATIPVKDADAKVGTLILGVARSFSLFGLTAQAYGSIPFTTAKASGVINGERMSQKRTGTSDTRFRLSVLLRGAPATTLKDFGKRKASRTILGTSLTIQAPTGQYFEDKLINLGTSRWAFKPEFAISQPIHKRWSGESLRKQDPVANFQLHTSYNIRPNMRLA